ncbi:alpha/beta fold hydrolase [Spirillospora sp. NPDC052269]
MTDLDDLWLRGFHSGPDDAPTLVCFPHAGGSATYFRPLSEALSRSLRVLAVQYPGRQDRIREPLPATIDEFADAAFTALEPLMKEPVAFLGHSMGAVIAFEVATRMKERLDAHPSVLFLSGRRSPAVQRESAVHLLDDAGLVEHLKRTSDTDPRILEDASVLEMILPPLRSDYRAVETYRYRPGPKLDCPVVALVGEQDDSATAEDARGWADHTTAYFSSHTFPGGHFFLREDQAAVVERIFENLSGGR